MRKRSGDSGFDRRSRRAFFLHPLLRGWNRLVPVERADFLRRGALDLADEMLHRWGAFARSKNSGDFREERVASDAMECNSGQRHNISYHAGDDGNASAKGDMREDGQQTAGRGDDVRLESPTPCNLIGSRFLFRRDERGVGEAGCTDRILNISIELRRRCQAEVVPEKGVDPERPRHRNWQSDETDIDSAIDYELWQLVHRQFAGVKVDARPLFQKSAHLLLQNTRVRGGPNVANLDSTYLATSGSSADAFGSRVLFEDVAGLGQKYLAGRRKCNGSLCSEKQTCRQVPFDLLNLHGKSWRCDVQALGRTSKMEFLGECHKVAKVPQFHGWSPIIRLCLINRKNVKNERNSGICDISFVELRRRKQMSARISLVSMSVAAAMSVVAGSAVAADLPTKPYLTLETAKAIVAAAEAKATAEGWPGVIAVVDAAGLPILIERMDNAAVLSGVDLAPGKARTAALFRRESGALEDAINGNRPAVVTAQGYVLMRGGVPLIVNGEIVGAIGVSADTPDHDEQIARAGAEALAK